MREKDKGKLGRELWGYGDICKEKPAQYFVQVLLKYNHLHFCSYYWTIFTLVQFLQPALMSGYYQCLTKHSLYLHNQMMAVLVRCLI